MPLSPDQSDSVAKLMDLGVTLDQALLALVKESWDLSAAADACIDHVYTVTARKRPTVSKCEHCHYWTGGTLKVCCVACAREPGKGKHTRCCEANQAMRLQKKGNPLGGGAAADGPPAKPPAEPPAETLAEPPVTVSQTASRKGGGGEAVPLAVSGGR